MQNIEKMCPHDSPLEGNYSKTETDKNLEKIKQPQSIREPHLNIER
jgi:hypothetical protein